MYKIGDEVVVISTSKGETFSAVGTVQFIESGPNYLISFTTEALREIKKFPESFRSDLFRNGGSWSIWRSARSLRPLKFTDGLDNWV